MDRKRNLANIAHQVSDPDDGQNLQQFISDSPWSAQAVIQQVQREIAAMPELRTGGVLILDESPDEKWPKSAGAGRPHKRRPRSSRPQVLSAHLEVRQAAQRPDTPFQRFRVRNTERGELDDPFAMRRMWTIRDGEVAEERLVIRHEYGRRYTYALSNAPADTPLDRLAWLKCVRHFVERTNQDAKSEVGWQDCKHGSTGLGNIILP